MHEGAVERAPDLSAENLAQNRRGFLLVLKEPDLTVLQAGENAPGFLGGTLDDVLGQPVSKWLNEEALHLLGDRLALARPEGAPLHAGTALLNGSYFDLFAQRCGKNVVAEFEARAAKAQGLQQDIVSALQVTSGALQLAGNVQNGLNLAVAQIREFTGFERVMAYQILESGSGTVLAESIADGLQSFLGYHHPASDIPLPDARQADRTWFHYQPNCVCTPVSIFPAFHPLTGQPLELPCLRQRNLASKYSVYLKKMESRSGMFMPLLKNGEFWGLIVCLNHSAPLYVPFEIRSACELLTRVASLLLTGRGDREEDEHREKNTSPVAQVAGALATTSDLVNVLVDQRPGLLDFITAEGAAVVLHGKVSLVGVTPEAAQVQALIEWLAAGEQEIYCTDSLAQAYGEAGQYYDKACGLLAVRIAGDQNDYIVWFRAEEQPASGTSAGDTAGQNGNRRRRSAPWSARELGTARDLRKVLLKTAVRRVNELRANHENLRRANVELDAFNYMAAHELKEPLRGIHTYTEILSRDLENRIPPESLNQMHEVVRLTRHMGGLLESLLNYSRTGRQGVDVKACDVGQAVAEVIRTLAPRLREGAEVRVIGTLPTVLADSFSLSQVFMNLISNALKYNDKKLRVVEVGCTEEEGKVTFFVRDNGIGIAPRQQAKIFGIFQRLHGPGQFGGGAGAGLSIVRKIIERHGGRIWVESEPGQGSTFRFTLSAK